MKTNQKSQIIFEVTKMIKDLLKIEEEISSTTLLTNYGFDSIKSVEFVVDVEEKYNIYFEDEELLFDNFSNIESIVNLIKNKIS